MEALTNFFTAVGTVKEVYTLVDFLSYTKTVEYMICVAFFILFTKFYKYLNRDENSHEQRHVH